MTYCVFCENQDKTTGVQSLAHMCFGRGWIGVGAMIEEVFSINCLV